MSLSITVLTCITNAEIVIASEMNTSMKSRRAGSTYCIPTKSETVSGQSHSFQELDCRVVRRFGGILEMTSSPRRKERLYLDTVWRVTCFSPIDTDSSLDTFGITCLFVKNNISLKYLWGGVRILVCYPRIRTRIGRVIRIKWNQ